MSRGWVLASIMALALPPLLYIGMTEVEWVADPQDDEYIARQFDRPFLLPEYLPVRFETHRDSEASDAAVVILRFAYWSNLKDVDIVLTIKCGSERLVANSKTFAPLPIESIPAIAAGGACDGRDKTISARDTVISAQSYDPAISQRAEGRYVRLIFPKPPLFANRVEVQLPKITCQGAQCADIKLPAVVVFKKQRHLPKFTLHG